FHGLEPHVQIQVKHVDAVLRADYYVGAEISGGEEDIVSQRQRTGHCESLAVRPSESELGVGECVQHRIRLQVAVRDGDTPIPAGVHGGRADSQPGQITLIAAAVRRIGETFLVGWIAWLEVVDRFHHNVAGLKRYVVNELAFYAYLEPWHRQPLESRD